MMATLLYQCRVSHIGLFRGPMLTGLNSNSGLGALLLMMKIKYFCRHQTTLGTGNNHLFAKVRAKHIEGKIGPSAIGIVDNHEGMVINIRCSTLIFKVSEIYRAAATGIHPCWSRLGH